MPIRVAGKCCLGSGGRDPSVSARLLQRRPSLSIGHLAPTLPCEVPDVTGSRLGPSAVGSPASDAQIGYRRRRRRGEAGPWLATCCVGLLGIFFLVEAFAPFSLLRLVLAMATLALAARLWMCDTIFAGHGVVVWRSIIRTRRWPYEAVDRFEVATRPKVFSAVPEPAKTVLRIHLTDGRLQWLAGLEEPLGEDRDWMNRGQIGLEDVASRLNALLAEKRPFRAERRAG